MILSSFSSGNEGAIFGWGDTMGAIVTSGAGAALATGAFVVAGSTRITISNKRQSPSQEVYTSENKH